MSIVITTLAIPFKIGSRAPFGNRDTGHFPIIIDDLNGCIGLPILINHAYGCIGLIDYARSETVFPIVNDNTNGCIECEDRRDWLTDFPLLMAIQTGELAS